MKNFLFLSFFLLSIICAAGDFVNITDLNGRQVKVPANPQKVICIAPGTLRLAVYLQITDKIVGIENMEVKEPRGRPYMLAHPGLKKLPIIGPGGLSSINQMPDFEAVLKVAPDIIFITYMDSDKADKITRLTGIPVVVFSYGPFGSFDSKLYGSIRLMGKIMNKDMRAESVISFIESGKKELEKLSFVERGGKRPGVYVGGLGFKGETGIISSSSLFVPFVWNNADNVLKTKPLKEHVLIDNEKLLLLNPEYIFITGGNAGIIKQELKRKSKFYNILNAFKNNDVYNLYPFNWYITNIGTAILDAYAIGKIIYPDKFQDMNLRNKAGEIYSFLIGKDVYEQMKNDYGEIGGRIVISNRKER